MRMRSWRTLITPPALSHAISDAMSEGAVVIKGNVMIDESFAAGKLE